MSVAKLPQMAAPVTSVAFAPRSAAGCSGCSGSGRDVLAVGLESGDLELWSLTWQPGAAVGCSTRQCSGWSLETATTVHKCVLREYCMACDGIAYLLLTAD